MSSRSPSATRICQAAVHHFSEHGYDGGSLADIAELVGIRKASLYSHYAGKDELYTAALEEAAAIETAFAAQRFTEGETADAAPGGGFFFDIPARYGSSEHQRFLIRAAYVTPLSVKAQTVSAYEKFLGAIGNGYLAALNKHAPSLSPEDQEIFRETYVGMAESLFVELVYGNASSVARRQNAMWRTLADSLEFRLTRAEPGSADG